MACIIGTNATPPDPDVPARAPTILQSPFADAPRHRARTVSARPRLDTSTRGTLVNRTERASPKPVAPPTPPDRVVGRHRTRHRVSVDLFAKTPVPAKGEAEKVWLPKFVTAVMEGRWPEVEETANEPMTFATLVPLYVERYCEPQGINMDSDQSRLDILKAQFGHLPLSALERPGPVEDFRADLLARGLKPATINRYLARLRAMLNWAIGRELMTRNPISGRTGLRMLHEGSHRVRRVSEMEERLLLTAADCDPMMRARIIAGLDTGMRRGEILKLQKRHIVWTEGVIRVVAENAKSRKERQIPIGTTRLKKVLEQRRFLEDDAFVFGTEEGKQVTDCRVAWDAVLLRAGITDRAKAIDGDLHFHDMRHECGSRMAEGGVPLHEIKALLGHSSITTTQRYLNATLESLKKSITVLERSHNGHTDAPEPTGTPHRDIA